MTMKEVIIQSGLNGSQFSRKYDIPYRTISDWCRGLRKPPDYVVSILYRVSQEDKKALR